MTELKQTEINFEESVNETDAPIFKLKVTNIRKSAYTTNTPEESDLFKFKIGDYIGKPHGNAIFQVVSIHREPITQSQIDVFTKHKHSSYRSQDLQKTKDLFAEYQKNGNFGACRITIKPLVRGAKEITKGKLVKFLEVDQIQAITYNGYGKIDLPNLIKTRDYWITSIKAKMMSQQSKLDSQVAMRDAILKLMNPPQPVIVQSQTQVITSQEVDLAAA